MAEAVVRIENLCKQYRYGVISHGTLYKDLQSWWARFRGKEDPNLRITDAAVPGLDGERFWALQDINIEIKEGERVGIIGRNGAGKSTLLKILSRVTTPTKGLVKLKGRVASLLEVGTGFHPEQTGRENIFLNGAILGMSRAEIRCKLDAIVSFAGIARFLDTPVKRYSSGMYVRLAFAIAAHLDSEILVVDEVLAVGDVEFQKKCLGKMKDISGQGRTILFVSHNMSAIRNLCDRAVLLENGRCVLDSDAGHTIAQYLDRNLLEGAVADSDELEARMEGQINRNNAYLRFREIAVVNRAGVPQKTFNSDEDIIVSISFECLQRLQNLYVLLSVVDENNLPILSTWSTDDANVTENFYELGAGLYKTSCVLPGNTFGGRVFFLTVCLVNPRIEHVTVKKILEFEVKFQGYNNFHGEGGDVFIRPKLQWSMQPINREELISHGK